MPITTRIMGCVLSLGTVCVVGCSPEADVPTWDAVDPDAVYELLDNPDALLGDATSLPACVAESSDEVSSLESALNSVGDVLTSEELEEATPDEDDEDGEDDNDILDQDIGQGTTVFLKLACPGSDLENADTSFESGLMRVDSPRLTQDVLEDLVVEGDLLLTFEDCIFGEFTFNGEMPAFYTIEPFEIVGTITADVTSTIIGEDGEDEEVSLAMETPLALVSGQLQTTCFDDDGSYFTIDTNSETNGTVVRAADGEITCELDTGVCTSS